MLIRQLTFITLMLASLMAWLVWFLDLALVLVARKRINSFTNGALTGHIGNALWLGLAAAVSCAASSLESQLTASIGRFDPGPMCGWLRFFRSVLIQEPVP